jgi:serine/threonine-protein kinase
VIGTPDKNKSKYEPLKNALESKLVPNGFIDYLLWKRIDVSVESADSYPKSITQLQALNWDIVMAYSPVVSMAALDYGYKGIGIMFADRQGFNSVLITRKASSIKSLDDLSPSSKIALGDYFSASKYFAPMDILKGHQVHLVPGNSPADIKNMVLLGKVDAGALSRNLKNPEKSVEFNANDRRFRIIANSVQLPETIVGLSPKLNDVDRDVVTKLMLSLPMDIKKYDKANYNEGKIPNYENLSKIISGVKTLSTCSHNQDDGFIVNCPKGWIPVGMEAWITDVSLGSNRVILTGVIPAPNKTIKILVDRSILDKIAPVNSLLDLKGKRMQLLTTPGQAVKNTFSITHPHQLSF